jgi:general secretion pathway protein E
MSLMYFQNLLLLIIAIYVKLLIMLGKVGRREYYKFAGAEASLSAIDEFAKYLASKNCIVGDLNPRPVAANVQASENALHKLWESTDLSANDFADEVAKFCGLPRLHLPQLMAASAQVDRFTPRFLREMAAFPYQAADGKSRLVVADPTDLGTLKAAEIVLGGPITIEVASFEDIATILTERLGDNDGEISRETIVADYQDDKTNDDIENLRDLASGAPVVRAVNDLLDKALELRASDIHVEPFYNALSIRMRIDGLLRSISVPSDAPAQALTSRIKILSGLNIAERRLPQDGAARLRVGRSNIDIRVATMPTQHGESVVVRLLPRDRGLLDIDNLGLCREDETTVGRLLELPHGMVVITGPTGSGKTTTLATMLSILNQPTRKILTIEDPVEYEIHGVNQSQVKPSIGLTFAAAMRAFVRQDPDVIMVGEIRDSETAHIAVHAALTGHLVLTTLHTETAAAAIPRLLDLNVEGFLLKSTLRAVIAQRLVRILCDRCKIGHELTHDDFSADPRIAALGFKVGDTIYRPAGCERCSNTGYRGRTGVFEILEMNKDVRRSFTEYSDAEKIDQAAIDSGMATMVDDAVKKCRKGTTSISEILRVTTLR